MPGNEPIRRCNIGMLVNDLYEDYCKSLCEGAARAAEELDCNLYIYSGRLFDNETAGRRAGPYAYQYNTVFSYAASPQIDALVVCVGTAKIGESSGEIKRFLDSIGNIPVVLIGQRREGCSSVAFDQYKGMSDAVEHLIGEHGCRHIAFVGGPVENPESGIREKAYRDTLKKHGIRVSESLIVHGDFTMHHTKPIAELLDRDKDLDAICFANDLMAGAGYQLLRERGIEPGTDIAVTGYDDSLPTAMMTPPLTTIGTNPVGLAYAAVECAVRRTAGGEPEDVMIETSFVRRNSCGCRSEIQNIIDGGLSLTADPAELVDKVMSLTLDRMNFGMLSSRLRAFYIELASYVPDESCVDLPSGLAEKFRSILRWRMPDPLTARSVTGSLDSMCEMLLGRASGAEKRESVLRLFCELHQCVSDALMISNFSLAREARGGVHLLNTLPMYESSDLESQLDMITRQFLILNMLSSYIYLVPKPVETNSLETYKPFEKLFLKAYTLGSRREVMTGDGEMMPAGDIFRNRFMPDRRCTMVLSTMFYRSEQFGLFACELPHSQMYYTQMLTMQLCLIVKNVFLINQLNKQNAILSTMASEDNLTGLLNKRGFQLDAEDVLSDEENCGRIALIAYIDMNNLKLINDGFGHDEGNFALKLITSVLRKCFGEDAVIGRVGGDEFNVLKILSGSETPGLFRQMLKSEMKKASDSSGKPYTVSFSIGMSVAVCESGVMLENCLTMADNDMYSDKRNKPGTVDRGEQA